MLSISTIIPHAGGRKILRDCLTSLAKTRGVDLEVIIVDNSQVSDVDEETLSILPSVQNLRYECKLGFAGACNRGVESASGDYIFLLNNDAVVEPDTIKILADKIEQNHQIGACQPKILSLNNSGYFDYSSAAGGELDRYGFPFARGRVFDTIEKDSGQYNEDRQVFWGAGAALMIRRNLYISSGGLEERFFAHMEEIDLLWRIQLMGFQVFSVSNAVVYHRGAVTIRSDSFTKQYLNHRNSIATIFRNYSALNLLRYFPLRVLLDKALLIYSLFRGDFKRFWAVIRAGCWFWLSLPYLIEGRRRVQRLRKVPDVVILERLYPHSIAWQYFIRNRRTWSELQSNLA